MVFLRFWKDFGDDGSKCLVFLRFWDDSDRGGTEPAAQCMVFLGFWKDFGAAGSKCMVFLRFWEDSDRAGIAATGGAYGGHRRQTPLWTLFPSFYSIRTLLAKRY